MDESVHTYSVELYLGVQGDIQQSVLRIDLLLVLGDSLLQHGVDFSTSCSQSPVDNSLKELRELRSCFTTSSTSLIFGGSGSS